jgi:hypothetical protein
MGNRQGWCAGSIIASESDPGRGKWLTVWGSYYTAPDLHTSREDAQASGQRGESIAHVTEVDYPGVGRAYQVTAGTLSERNPEPPGPELCAAGCGRPAAPGNAGRCDQPGTCLVIRAMARH